MKKIRIVFAVITVLLTGCSHKDSTERAMCLRQDLLKAEKCTFRADITAIYENDQYSFSLSCCMEPSGKLNFSVISPETITGISGFVDGNKGGITFDDQVLGFPLMADGTISPVSAPWVLMKTLRSGYITSCGKEENLYRILLDDSYEAKQLHTDIWIDDNNIPVRGDILWNGRRALSVTISEFVIQ